MGCRYDRFWVRNEMKPWVNIFRYFQVFSKFKKLDYSRQHVIDVWPMPAYFFLELIVAIHWRCRGVVACDIGMINRSVKFLEWNPEVFKLWDTDGLLKAIPLLNIM